MNFNKKKAYKVGLIAFAISFIVYELILVWHFLYLYYDELVNKNIFSECIKLSLYMGSTLMIYTIPLATITASAIFYRHLFKHYKLSIRTVLNKGIPIALVLASIVFIYSAFVNHTMNLKALSLLYDIRTKKPDEPLKRTNKNLFQSAYQTQSIIEQYHSTDSMKKKSATTKIRLIEMAKKTEDVELKYRHLPDSLIKQLNIKPDALKRDRSIKIDDGMDSRGIENETRSRVNIMSVYVSDILSTKHYIKLFTKALLDHFVWSLLAIVGYFVGLFLGVLSRRVHILVLIFGINWGGGAMVFYINSITQKLLLSWGFGIYSATLLPFILQLIFLWLLYTATKQSLIRWHIKPRLIPHVKPENE